MKKSAKLFFSAMGSILDLCPAGGYSEYRYTTPDADLINSDWVRVGGYMRHAVTDNEQKKISKKASNRRPEKSC